MVEMRDETVSLTGLQMRQQLLDGALHLGEFLNERRAVHYRVISRCSAMNKHKKGSSLAETNQAAR
jgi:hypothetical protein